MRIFKKYLLNNSFKVGYLGVFCIFHITFFEYFTAPNDLLSQGVHISEVLLYPFFGLGRILSSGLKKAVQSLGTHPLL